MTTITEPTRPFRLSGAGKIRQQFFRIFAHWERAVMLRRLGKLIFWFTLNIGVIDFRMAMVVCVAVVGVGLGVLVSLAGSDYL